jgi:hypothetical protein
MRSRAVWFGPVMERRSAGLVAWWPIEPERIDEVLTEGDSITEADVREFFPSSIRGLGALEYLLFADEAKILNELDAGDTARCQYATALTSVAADEVNAVLAEWNGTAGDGEPYAARFNGTAQAAILERTAVSEAVRTSVFLIRALADMQLGAALGIDRDAANLDALPEGLAGNGLADLRNQLLGMRDVYAGADSSGDALGVGDLVQGVSPEAHDRALEAFDDALTRLDALDGPMRTAIADDADDARALHESLTSLRRVLETEVVSLLGVTVGFSDTDGDGG